MVGRSTRLVVPWGGLVASLRASLVVSLMVGGTACSFAPAGEVEPDEPVIGVTADGGDAAIAVDATPDARVATPPADYTPTDDDDDDAWYRAVPVAAPMAVAAADCADDGPGAALVTVDDEDANARLFALVVTRLDGRRSWLGITDADEEGVWRTVGGAAVDVTAWADGEPNDAGALGEDCAILLGRFDPEEDQGAWNDVGCTELRPYVCQWRPR